MACAVVCSSHHAARSLISASDVPKQDFFLGKCDLSLSRAVPMRRSSVINAAVRSSLETSTDFGGRYSSACIDQPCALSCPVNRETNVERWVEESVHEIVRNIQEAPFLQYVFDSTSRFRRSQRQKLSQECFQDSNYWPSIKESFSKADPDGVILVQKLEPGCSAACCLAEAFGDEEMVCPLQAEGAETNVWGVFVQARGLHTSACYLLKTTRVSSPGGACTRYCLTRAACFGPSHVEQLENAWLL
ncbi:hypothetical protein M758_6G134100 [Ceratodon purpureus]|nr:hypothetical protein M758_6G134100 [Ceratodon purpureus]